jgi:hypothetical protein
MSDDLKTTASNSAVETFDDELGRLLHPARFFRHPRDVVRDATLTPAEKRAILSSWASDASAIESMPALRHIPGSDVVVQFDDIIDALEELDLEADERDCGGIGETLPGARGRRGGGPDESSTGSGNWF